MKSPLRFLVAFFAVGTLVACSGGGRGVELTPNEIAALPSFGDGDCRALVQNLTGRRIEVFYQTGLEEYKRRAPMETWPTIDFMEVSENAILRAPCSERQVVIGWRIDGNQQVIPDINEVVFVETLREGQTVPARIRRPSSASCITDNAQNSIRSRCILGAG